ncbi:Utp6p [Paramicrosporidium saccamoebae]|uniref:Utp6p n=1 Tax=Paramicrosporidium saccamoebae TaxID=1246581 RepID=A0A2H9TGC7_9FUNG|nr:Utp6p [Paramicrosporidium saccamoebae]
MMISGYCSIDLLLKSSVSRNTISQVEIAFAGVPFMAEQVQLHLEARLPELQELSKKGIFSEEKVRDIVSRRTKFEYRLKRRGAILEDFLGYIDFEKQLEAERLDRTSELAIKSRSSLSNYSIVQHVYGLYQRALVKFKGEVSLWKQFLEYALLQGGRQVFSKNITKAIQHHPLHHPFWIMAAKFEWEIRGNMVASRTLLQQAIRINAGCPELWMAFFDLELDFAKKVQERRQLLGLGDLDSSVDEDENVLSGALAILIFDHALKSIATLGPAVAHHFMNVAARYPEFAKVYEHIRSTYLSIHFRDASFLKSFVQEALCQGFTPDALQIALGILDEAFASAPTSSLLNVCVDFLLEIPKMVEADLQGEIQTVICDKVDQIFMLAEEKQILTPALYARWVSLFNELGYTSESREGVLHRMRTMDPASADVTVATIRSSIDHCSNYEHLKNILLNISKVSEESRRDELLSHLCSKWILVSKGITAKQSLKFLLKALGGSRHVIAESFQEILCQFRKLYGLSDARSLCIALSAKRTVNAKFYRDWILMELCGTVDELQVRKLFNAALMLDKKDESLWADFIRFERSQKRFSEAALLYDRAIRELPVGCSLVNKLN